MPPEEELPKAPPKAGDAESTDAERPAARESEAGAHEAEPSGEEAAETRAARIATDPRLLAFAKAVRKVLPGDSRFGDDPLSTAGDTGAQALGRRFAEATAEKPSVMREAGLTALQVWQAMAQAAGRMPVGADLTIAFTDLVGFSKWSLKAGDDAAVVLLREVSTAIEPPVTEQGGKVVKRLGDGMMAKFLDAEAAVEAILEAQHRLADVEVAGHRPRLRAGLHTGRPERVGDDYFGVDVNIAARVADAAAGGEILVSDAALAELDDDRYAARRKVLFRAKGVPGDIKVYAVRRAG